MIQLIGWRANLKETIGFKISTLFIMEYISCYMKEISILLYELSVHSNETHVTFALCTHYLTIGKY